jgi:Tfp pilus assembly protein PilO
MPVNFSKNVSMSIKLPGKSSRNSLFEVGLLIIICVLFTWFILLPKKGVVDEKNSNLAKVQEQQKQMANQLAKLQNLIISLQPNSRNIANLDKAIPLEGNAIRLQLLIQSLAQSAGVTVGNINISSKSNAVVAGDTALLANPYGTERKLQTMDGTIYVIGSFNQLQALLKKLENSGRLINVSSMEINQGSEGALNMTLSFKAYYLAP